MLDHHPAAMQVPVFAACRRAMPTRAARETGARHPSQFQSPYLDPHQEEKTFKYYIEEYHNELLKLRYIIVAKVKNHL